MSYFEDIYHEVCIPCGILPTSITKFFWKFFLPTGVQLDNYLRINLEEINASFRNYVDRVKGKYIVVQL